MTITSSLIVRESNNMFYRVKVFPKLKDNVLWGFLYGMGNLMDGLVGILSLGFFTSRFGTDIAFAAAKMELRERIKKGEQK